MKQNNQKQNSKTNKQKRIIYKQAQNKLNDTK